MFGLFKSQEEKVANTISEMFSPLIFSLESRGVHIETILKDDFLIAYLCGAISMAARLSGLSGEKSGLTTIYFLNDLFPSKDNAIAMRLAKEHMIKLENEVYFEAHKQGILEFQKMSGGMGSMEMIKKYILEYK